jgi:hypothetical protein
MAEPWFVKYERAFLARQYQNDAQAYGVVVERVATPYYRAIGVHHLTPDENHGLHNVYLDVINSRGDRIRGIPVAYDWRGRRPDEDAPPVALDKPDDEPGANIPIGLNQFITVWVAGSGPSDKVTGLATVFPDEGDGNYMGHHSWLVVFLARDDGQPAPNEEGWTQLELAGLSYELTNAANAIGNAQALLATHRRGVS